jgi:hypothetical protein
MAERDRFDVEHMRLHEIPESFGVFAFLGGFLDGWDGYRMGGILFHGFMVYALMFSMFLSLCSCVSYLH